ncbi:MAG: sulfurtransferase TusA family protein, partial [Tannerella sp.]|nr:sulfurtransferase TusA family protein [Tannerella sp.]
VQGFDIWQSRYVTKQRQEGYYSVYIPVIHGNIHINNEKAISELQRLLLYINNIGKDTLRFTNEQSIRLRNIPKSALPGLYGIITDVCPESDKSVIANNLISCTGADTCRLGIGLAKGLSSAIRRELLRSDLDLDRLADVKIHISGCPNSCGQHFLADIGFSGKILRNDRVYPGYQVWLAAHRDEKPQLSQPVGNISAHDVPVFVRRLLKAYLNDATGLTLTEYLESDGQIFARQLLDEYKAIPSFEDDKNYYYDWGADTPFSIVERGQAECSAGLFDMIDVDRNNILDYRKALETETSASKINRLLYDTAFSASRMLLVTRGAEPKTTEDVFNLFISHFIDTGLVNERFRKIVTTTCNNDNEFGYSILRDDIFALADTVIELYGNMDDSLQFKNVVGINTAVGTDLQSAVIKHQDLRGVACPMNFVKTKILLSTMQTGDTLEILLDDGQPIANVPGSVRNEGHEILEQTQTGNYWKVLIKKK